MSEQEVEVTKAEILCVQADDGTFALMNAKTMQMWPVSKQGMLTLANQLELWFEEIAWRLR